MSFNSPHSSSGNEIVLEEKLKNKDEFLGDLRHIFESAYFPESNFNQEFNHLLTQVIPQVQEQSGHLRTEILKIADTIGKSGELVNQNEESTPFLDNIITEIEKDYLVLMSFILFVKNILDINQLPPPVKEELKQKMALVCQLLFEKIVLNKISKLYLKSVNGQDAVLRRLLYKNALLAIKDGKFKDINYQNFVEYIWLVAKDVLECSSPTQNHHYSSGSSDGMILF
jgi:hypothetical protein